MNNLSSFEHLVPTVKTEFKPMLDFLFDHTDGEEFYRPEEELRDRWQASALDKNEASVNLRFDFQVSDDLSDEEAQGAAVSVCAYDMADLLVNGDVTNGEDALLKTFSGERKRGQKLADFKVLSAKLYREYKHREGFDPTWEYTLYVRPYAKFE